jgi:NAD(P)-dependent dehydrogenase (short-subunit alcohol dehydrogenase family)
MQQEYSFHDTSLAPKALACFYLKLPTMPDMKPEPWTDAATDLTGNTYVVTGANSGIGLEVVRELARRGGRVVLAVRSLEAGREAALRLRNQLPVADLTVEACDLSDLKSVRRFAERIVNTVGRIDVLVNNAGIMAVPFGTTVDGHERHFGTNHLGHFALTGRLLPVLLESERARVVTVASDAHRIGRIDPDNLNGSRYRRWSAYGRSKLANLLFAYELDRRARAAGAPLVSVACHPGYADTNLQGRSARERGKSDRAWRVFNRLAQTATEGARPVLRAATDPTVEGGTYYGPRSRRPGSAIQVRSSKRSHDPAVAERLWEVSEQLTSVRFQF